MLLDAVLQQTYPRSSMEMLIADGLSQDRTREIISDFRRVHPDLAVSVQDNPSRTIPSGLNLAGAAARGEVIIRLDAHCIPIPEYVERCVEALEAGKGSVVGGVWIIQPGGRGFVADGIAQAAAHPLGVGDAMYRLHAAEGSVDTVPFGAFRRRLFDELGGFDRNLLTNEDYEFNARVRQRGGVVWLDPRIQSIYIARASLPALARQYWRYGFWKLKMLQRHPGSIRWRQALPPLFVLSLVVLAVLSFFSPSARLILAAEVAVYLVVLIAAGLEAAIRLRTPILIAGLGLAIATMHIAWGSGFLWSIFSPGSTAHG